MHTMQGPESVEIRRLDEGIRLLRDELRSMREELRKGFEGRPTHADLGNLKLLTETRITHLQERIMDLEKINEERTRYDRQRNIALIGTGVGALVSLFIAALSIIVSVT
jgi:hypothetical protein